MSINKSEYGQIIKFHQCSQGDGESAAARAAEAKRRAMARRKAKNQQIRATQLRLGSPPAVPGRKHERVQTELYLEEIYVNPPVTDMCTQTDLFVERPVSPFYVPAKIGADVATQIYPGDVSRRNVFIKNKIRKEIEKKVPSLNKTKNSVHQGTPDH